MISPPPAFEKGVDIIKSRISALELRAGGSFILCGKQDVELYNMIKKVVIGGPSIISNRHQNVGGDSGAPLLITMPIIALYLYEIGTPVDRYVHFNNDDDSTCMRMISTTLCSSGWIG